MIIVDLHGGI